MRFIALSLLLAAIVPIPDALADGVTPTPAVGHPQLGINVSGSGFAAKEAIDIYFDTTDEVLTVSDGTGAFSNVPLIIPAAATPGVHWITAIGRKDGTAFQATFNVRTDWSQFRFTASGKRSNPYENVINAGNVWQLEPAWTFTTGGHVYSSPVVASGRLYIGSTDHNLYALDPTTGALLWTATTGDMIQCSPAVANGRVYVNSYDGYLYAFNATTGKQLWKSPKLVDADSSPTVANGIVYVGGYNVQGIFAFNAKTGAQVWSQPVDSVVEASPAISQGVLYVASNKGTLYSFDAATGTPLWDAPFVNQAIYSSPIVSNGLVYVGSGADSQLWAFYTQDGGSPWRGVTGATVNATAAAANGLVYESSYDGKLYAFNPINGTAVWTFATPYTMTTSPAVANGVVYVGGCTDGICALDAKTGQQLWFTSIDAGMFGSATVANGMVYEGDFNGIVHAYALNGGDNAVYRRNRIPPSYASLHPDFRLKPVR